SIVVLHYIRVIQLSLFFFFQAEDGIRDFHVTGVQTCALPISGARADGPYQDRVQCRGKCLPLPCDPGVGSASGSGGERHVAVLRSEERRVGKECRSRWWRGRSKEKRHVRQRV